MSGYAPYPRERSANPLIRGHTKLLGVSFHGGRVLSASQLPLFMLMPPLGYGVLTTTGRRTGRQRSKCVRAIRRGDRAYVVSIAGERAAWLKNIRADPKVSLRIRGGTFGGRARELDGASDREQAMAAYCETVNLFDYAECALWRRGRPTRTKITDLHRGWFAEGVAVAIELGGLYAATGSS